MKKATTEPSRTTATGRIVEPKKLNPMQIPVSPAEYLPANVLVDAGNLPARVAKFTVIKTDLQLKEADQVDGMLADMIKLIETDMKPLKDAAFKAHKAITKYESDKVTPLKEARQKLSRLVGQCLMDRRLAAEEAARKQEIENARLAREQAERDREARLEVLVAEGKDDEVEELLETELVVENTRAVRVEPIVPTGLGMHAVSRWVGEVTDFKALLQAVLDGKVPMGTIDQPGPVMINQPYLNKMASLQKSTMMIPGVTAKDVGGTSR